MIVFFIRRYNDIDHVVPVVYKVASEGVPCRVLSLEPLMNLDADYRLQFLRERCGVPIESVYRVVVPTMAHRFAAAVLAGPMVQSARAARAGELLRQRSRAGSRWWLELLLLPLLIVYRGLLFAWLYERFWRPRFYGPTWAAALVATLDPALLVFDWVPVRKFMIADLLAAARARGIRCVSIPHGVHIISDELRAAHATRAGQVKRTWPLAAYDAVAVPEPLFKSFLVKTGVDPDKVAVLGSPRFCDEWEGIHDTILPPSTIPAGLGAGTVKVVYMDKSFRSRMHADAVVETLTRIGRMPGVTLVIKPETRGNTASSQRTAAAGLMATSIASLDLIRWADVVIGVTSSILLEVLVQKKLLVYPTFFSENVTFFQDYGACWTVDTPAELVAAIDTIRHTPGHRPYADASAERLLDDVVYGGRANRDVLGGYRDFLMSRVRGASRAMEAAGA